MTADLRAAVERAEAQFRESLEAVARKPEFQAACRGLAAAGREMVEGFASVLRRQQ